MSNVDPFVGPSDDRIQQMIDDPDKYFAEARERAAPAARRYVEERLNKKRRERTPLGPVTPFVERAWREWGIPPYRTQKQHQKPLLRRLLVLARSFANPHDAAHLAICASICTTLHFVLEWIL